VQGEGERAGLPVRVAGQSDLAVLTQTLWRAFGDDPLWRWAFPDHHGLFAVWRLFITGALRYPWVFMVGEGEAASVWIPPSGTELTPQEEERVEPLLGELLGRRAAEVLELFERFEASHPKDPPHFYLSLLGTHPDRRGRGLGMGLLAENLERIDAQGMPAYLESSNPDNDRRYERFGFERIGEFSTPDGARVVGKMWREPGTGRRSPGHAPTVVRKRAGQAQAGVHVFRKSEHDDR
jgi:GNAT superfamily N-acetyltransferase